MLFINNHNSLATATVSNFTLLGTMAADKKPFERLPTDVVPTNYKLELRPDLKLFKFTGTLDITMDVSELAA